MNVKTKYDINDNVFFISDNKIHNGYIQVISIHIPHSPTPYMVENNMGNYTVEYRVNYGAGETFKTYEHLLFPTKEELIKSL